MSVFLKSAFRGDYKIEFDGENISFIDNKQPSLNFEMRNKIRTRDPRNKSPIKYTELFEASAFETLYNKAVKDNLKTEKMEFFSFNKETKEIKINNGIETIYEPKINQQISGNNKDQEKQFLRSRSAFTLRNRIKDGEATKDVFGSKKRPSTGANKVNVLQEEREQKLPGEKQEDTNLMYYKI